MDKKDLAGQLKEAARLLEVLGDDAFRARAYQNAARQLEAFEGDFEALVAGGRFSDIRGIGAGLAAELSAAAEEGLLPLLGGLRERVPAGVRDLFVVSGLGAKKIAVLWAEGVDSLEALLAAADDGRVAALKGFGAKSAEKFRAGAAFALEAGRRWRLDQAALLAGQLVAVLAEAFPRARVAVAGELRRSLETVDAVELVVSGADQESVTALLGDYLEALGVVGDGQLEGVLDGRPVRVTLCAPEAFGAALALTTGNEAYLDTLRRAANAQGLSLTSNGLEGTSGHIPSDSEEALFAALELPTVPPELREEADAAPVPDLLEESDIRGLVHNHSTWSDAVNSIPEMVAAAQGLGYAYLAMADHSRSSFYANGLSIERVAAQAEEIDALRRQLDEAGSAFELLHGIEVDILPDGSLDYPDEVLATLDYTVVSVHQNFTLSRAEQTERIVTAVRHPLASILGHATGRLMLRRPPYEVDLEAVIDACAESGTVIEINASPYRLDLDWRWVRVAKAEGCRFSVNPDAHRSDGFDDVRYGVGMARKAGLTPAEVVNTAPSGQAFLARLGGV